MKVVIKNISSKNSFRIECQKCKCKKVSLHIEYGITSEESDSYCLVCCHCGHRKELGSFTI